MPHMIRSATPLEGFELLLRFRCGESRRYDVKPLMETISLYGSYFSVPEYFDQVSIAEGRQAVFWNEYVDIGCEELWRGGRTVRSPFDNLLSFSDAAALWRLDESTLRKAVAAGRLRENADVLKFGKQWVITRKAMKKVFGEPGDYPSNLR